MDKELIQKLGNLADSLEAIAQALDKSKSKSTTATGTALQSGDFSKQIQEISVGIKSIKDDTKKILDNQETIIKMQKQNSGKNSQLFEETGKSNKKEMIKDGVGAIILIAGAVLAIGAAFSILGDVPIATVIGLAVALPILAFTFQKLSTLDLNMGKIMMVGGIMSIISLSIALSSKILEYVSPLPPDKIDTIVKIGEMFLAFNLIGMIGEFSGMKTSDALIASSLMPVVLVALSLAISASSHFLSGVKKVGNDQLITSLAISGAFLILSYAAKPLMKGLSGISGNDIKNGVVALLALTGAVVGASYLISAVSNVDTGKIFKFLGLSISVSASVLMIAGTVHLVNKMGTLNKYIEGSASILVLVSSIAASSIIFGTGEYKKVPDLFWILKSGLSILAFGLLSWGLNKFGSVKDYVSGGLSVVAVSGAIAASSIILNSGEYFNHPGLGWSIGVGTSILAFGLGVIGLGLALSSGIGVVAFGLGLAFIPLLSLAIVASDKILSIGKYGKYPSVDWSSGVSISLLAFSTAVMLLGSIAASGVGIIALGLGGLAVMGVSKVIVKTADILSEGKFNGSYPNLGWSLGVGTALVGFSSVMLPLSLISPFLLLGGLATLGIAKVIVKTSDILSKGKYSGGPTKDWAEGISLALGAFAPVYSMLIKEKLMSIFSKGVSVDDFGNAIRTISQGIVDAGNFFNGSQVFKGGPTKEWAEGVGLAISAFAPVYQVLSDNSGWMSSGVSVDDMKSAILSIAQGIVDVARFFGSNSVKFDTNNMPSSTWSENIRSAVESFGPIFDFVDRHTGENTIYAIAKFKDIVRSIWDFSDNTTLTSFFGGKSPLQEAVSNISLLGDAFSKLSDSVGKFTNSISAIDSEKLSAIRSLSSNVVLMSLMDPEQFEDMMDKMESKSKVFASLMQNDDRKPTSSSGSIRVVATGGTVKTDSQVLGEKVDRMTAILADISSVVGSRGTLKTYLSSLKETQIVGSDNSPHHRSDRRLKNILKLIGKSDMGINIYLFSYKFNPNVYYKGVIAQELVGTKFESALVIDKNGFYSVDYSQIDVPFKKMETSEI